MHCSTIFVIKNLVQFKTLYNNHALLLSCDVNDFSGTMIQKFKKEWSDLNLCNMCFVRYFKQLFNLRSKSWELEEGIATRLVHKWKVDTVWKDLYVPDITD